MNVVFRDSYVLYIYMSMNIPCTFHISVSWVCYNPCKILGTILQQMNQRTKKLMIGHKVLHFRDDIDRQYASRKEGGKRYNRIEDNTEINEERQIIANWNNTNYTRINWITITRKKIGDKQLYGRFNRQTSQISHEKTWTWLGKWNIKRETAYLLIAVQNNATK